jgi:hypothetical protein
MSDDLVKRLRYGVGYWPETGREAADRIEELEAKLAKAVEMLDRLSFARTTLAELKGEADD